MRTRKFVSRLITQYEIVQSLQRQLPDGSLEDFNAVAGLLCDKKPMVTLDGLFLNVFVNVLLFATRNSSCAGQD